MSDIRFNQWLHQSGTGGVSQVASGAVGVGTTNPLADFYVRGDAQITGILTAGHIAMGSSITFGDDDRAYFGNGTDLQIYHSGSDSFISDTGTGDLLVTTSQMRIKNAANNATMALFTEGGKVQLWHNNSQKFETTGYGATVFGELDTTNLSISGITTIGKVNQTLYSPHATNWATRSALTLFGNYGGGLAFNDNNNNGWVQHVSGSGVDFWLKNGAVGGALATSIKATKGGSVELYENGIKKFETTSSGVSITGTVTSDGVYVGDNEAIGAGGSTDLQLYHDASGSAYGTANSSYIKVQGTHDNILDIFTASATGKIRLKSNNLAETMLSATGNGAVELYHNNVKKFETTSLGWKSEDGSKGVFGTGGDFQIFHNGSNSFVKKISSGTGQLYLDSEGSSDLYLRAGDGSSGTNISMRCYSNAGVDLRYQGTKKFETTNTGATISGTLISDGLTLNDNEKLLIGNNTDIEVFHNGTNSIFQSDTGDLQINSGNSAGNVEINVNNNVGNNTRETSAKFIKNGAVELYHNDVKKCETTTTGLSITGTVSPTTPLSHRNFLINGSTTIWQRGTDSNLHTSSGTYTCDRWWRANGATRVVRSTAVPAGFPYSLEVYSNGNTTSIGQAIELSGTGRSQFKHSTQYTLSFYARTVTGTNDISANVYYRNDKFSTTNQTNWSGSAGNNSLWLMGTMTTSWQRFYKTFTSPGNPHANNKVLAIEFNNTSAYYITGIQFEEGAVTPFEFRNYQEELANCQRYYENVTGPSLQTTSHSETLIGVAQAYTSSRALMNYKFSVQKRQHPALECSSASNVQILVPSTGWVSAGNVYGYTNQMASRVDLRNISGSPLTVGHACEVRVINDGVIGFNAEL